MVSAVAMTGTKVDYRRMCRGLVEDIERSRVMAGAEVCV